MGVITIIRYATIKTKITIIMFCIFLFTAMLPSFTANNQKNDIVSVVGTKTGAYHTYQEMTDLLIQLQENYSDIMKLESQGTTYEGRTIWAVKLSDNVEVDETSEPGVLFLGAHHGNEKPSFETLIFFIQYLVETYYKENTDNDLDGYVNEDPIDGIDNDQDGDVDEDPSEDRVRDALNNTEIFVMPMVNPDGVEVDTRKNCAPNYGSFGLRKEITSYGVDLNRNYAYKWFLYRIFPRGYHYLYMINDEGFNYRGEQPFSENETLAVKNLVEAHDNIKVSLSFHSYGEFILFPWTHTSKDTPDEDLFISVGENITQINGFYLYTGNRDYIIPRYTGSLGTSENWLYGEKGILSYTVELCETRAPTDPEIIFEYCKIHVGVNLYVAERSPTIETRI